MSLNAILTNIEEPIKVYKRVIYFGRRNSYDIKLNDEDYNGRKLIDIISNKKTLSYNCNLLSDNISSPILIIYEIPNGERKFAEATVKRTTKRANK